MCCSDKKCSVAGCDNPAKKGSKRCEKHEAAMKKAMKIGAILVLLASQAMAQGFTPGGGGTLTAGTSPTSGCTDGGFLYSLSSLLNCGAVLTTDGSTVIANNGAAAAPIFIAKDNGSAVFTIADGGTITATGQYLAPLGSNANASIAATGGVGTGMYFRNVNLVTLVASTVQVAEIDSSAFNLGTSKNLAWYPALFGNPADLLLNREAAATLQMGADVNGAPVAQTLKAHDGITGTDKIGANLTIASGIGTGAGNGAQVNLNRTNALATGTTAQSSTNGFVVCESKILSNTSATTTTLATIGLASNTGGGASVSISVVASDGTNFDAETQTANLSFVNKAGTFTISTPTITASSAANNSGSATIGFTATGASSLISLKVTPVFTTIVPTSVRAYIEIFNHSAGAVTCQ